ncbi:hypothetical protein F0562_005355 [Nyssa sinensis]|uniref:F-box domain-containing protein n=1 Tax=Nyssa sinensis TaxID=561372 RepID=A0A5J5ANR1_9ASTE|nr:hypothetical protein F0562_005355 [Nyssa sinensis]
MRAWRGAPGVGGRWTPPSVGGAKMGGLGGGRRGRPLRGTGARRGAVSGISRGWEIRRIRLLFLQMGFKSCLWLTLEAFCSKNLRTIEHLGAFASNFLYYNGYGDGNEGESGDEGHGGNEDRGANVNTDDKKKGKTITRPRAAPTTALSASTGMSFVELTDDSMIEILSRLPPELVIGLKRVSKAWHLSDF